MWGELQQQDSQEFLIFIISQLEEELGNPINFIPGRIILNTYNKITKKDIYRICGLEKNKKDFSIIKELFIGTYSSNIICNFCKTYTPTFENFITLSVDIPLKLGQTISLNNCLKYTFKNEVFDKDNQVNCDFCGIKNKSIKQNKIWKSPKILIIHFKRFKVNDYGYNASKITNQIIYPINDFDIKKYFDKYSPHKNNSKYDLIGINIHQEFSHKSIDIGHYISIVKNRYNNEWYIFNDSNEPIKVNLSELQNKNAYMLFYFRKD